MRTTLTFNSNLESLSDYMTRVTAILRAIRDNVPAADGIDYSVELSEDEKLELYQQALMLAVEEMERTTGKHCTRKHDFGQDEEDFISNFTYFGSADCNRTASCGTFETNFCESHESTVR